jgi:hypothetical protein
MRNFKEFKIIKYIYPFPTEKLGEMVWDKMTLNESKWAVQLTLKGVNDTGDEGETSWDIFFLDNKLQDKIDEVLNKYKVPYVIEELSDLLLKNPDLFSDEFIKKLNSYLEQNLTVDDVLDNIIEVGIDNISIFERYFLDYNTENKD